MAQLRARLNQNIAGFMLTCLNTLGLFDPNLPGIIDLNYPYGGLCHCDGASLNAIPGRLPPEDL